MALLPSRASGTVCLVLRGSIALRSFAPTLLAFAAVARFLGFLFLYSLLILVGRESPSGLPEGVCGLGGFGL